MIYCSTLRKNKHRLIIHETKQIKLVSLIKLVVKTKSNLHIYISFVSRPKIARNLQNQKMTQIDDPLFYILM